MKNRVFITRLACAAAGVMTVWQREKTFRTHLCFALAAIVMAALLRVGPIWWAILGLCIAMILALEALNAALEYMLDRLHPERHEEVRCAKDAAAGAVLLAAIGTAAVGGLMLLDALPG